MRYPGEFDFSARVICWYCAGTLDYDEECGVLDSLEMVDGFLAGAWRAKEFCLGRESAYQEFQGSN